MKILVIEDDHAIREALTMFLEVEGGEVHIVDGVHDGYEAFIYLRKNMKHKPDVIIFDLAMPNMNGFEFRDQQLREADFCHIPVISMSAMHWQEWMKDKLGAEAYLAKPFDLDQILECISNIKKQKKNNYYVANGNR